MTLLLIRIFFVLASIVVGYEIGSLLPEGQQGYVPFFGAAMGAAGAVFIILFEMSTRKVSVKGLSSAVFGLILGLIMAQLIISLSFQFITLDETTKSAIAMILTLIFVYLGMLLAIRGRDEFSLIIPYVKLSRQDKSEEIIVLDTSVIIDGRIADICKTKFIEGKLIVPRFVLKELQQVADSEDSLKRNRGRRGLDVLNKIQKSAKADVKIHEQDFPEIQEVDAKLVRLAKMLEAKILTNDYNLNKIAELQGITVLNINELANALKPVMIPGEDMSIKLLKEGKEFNQAVGYLNDGTMVVVDNSKHLLGKTVSVVVSSVLQTAAGKMIFADLSSAKENKNHYRAFKTR
ncbi:MAG: PIN domain-containing protein [Candidatus Omnitrophota bacterium]